MLDVSRLNRLLTSRWTDFVDKVQLMKISFLEAYSRDYPEFQSENIENNIKNRNSITVTEFNILSEHPTMTVEFSLVRNGYLLVGTHIFSIRKDGSLEIKESIGAKFQTVHSGT